jgi:hypothetical protein
MVLTMGEHGLVVYLEVIVGGPVARRFLESWPKTFAVGRPPLLMYGGRQFWRCCMCYRGLISPVYLRCLLSGLNVVTLYSMLAFCSPSHAAINGVGISIVI